MAATQLDELFNAPAEFVLADGRKVLLGDLTELDRARFVRRLKDRAIGELIRFPDDTPPAVMRAFADSVAEGLASGVYDWGGPACVRSLTTQWGGSYAFFLAAKQGDDAYTEEEAAADWEAAVHSRIREMAEAAMAKATADPKA